MRLYATIAAVVVLAISSPMQASLHAANISGEWTLNFNGPQGPIDASATFKQDGENITGTIEGPQGTIECSGTLKDTKLALQMEVDANGQSISIFLLADVDGDTLKGSFSVAEMRGEWTGKRKS